MTHPLADFIREHSEIRRQIHKTLIDHGYRPGDGDYERQAEIIGMPQELGLKGIMLLLNLHRGLKLDKTDDTP